MKNTTLAKNQIQLSNCVVLTVNTYKMYFPPDRFFKICKENAWVNKQSFIESVAEGDDWYKKGYGKVPAGFVIQVRFNDRFTEGFLYGASIKSHLDKWDRMKGLKVAYADLMKSFASLNLSLSKEERRKIAEIVGLNK